MVISFQTGEEELTHYLKEHGFIAPDENILSIEKPGEGNMNFVARIRTQHKSLIIKQANPYVQKYPQIPAPQERILVEAEFYDKVKDNENLSKAMPSLLGIDKPNHVIILEDLGETADFTILYKKQQSLSDAELKQLVDFLNQLHAIPFHRIENYSANYALRSLNHQHLFIYPFLENNGLDLNTVQTGLHQIAMPYKTDTYFRSTAAELGTIYLSQGKNLLHGDYYPGSWLKANGRLKIIDPEFSFVGAKEFEVGVLVAHLKMSQATNNQISFVEKQYEPGPQFNWETCYQFAGIEIMRRIIGLAQLPFDLTLHEKEQLLKEAYTYIMK